jgi:uncharacterized protein YcnI
MTTMPAPLLPSSRRVRRSATALALAALSLCAPAIALAHAVVFPKASTPGAYEKYTLRVPNEKTVATVKVELRFPADVRVTAFGDVPGWQLEVLTDSAKRIVGAVWTGTLPPQRFVELPFVAANPRTATRLVWPTFQTYADGERVEWTGPEGAKAPASVTTLADPASAGAQPGETGAGPRWVPWAALALALVSLGLALRPRTGSRAPTS